MIVISHAKLQINVPSLPLLSKLSVSLKENPDRKKTKKKQELLRLKRVFFSANLLGEFAKIGNII